MTQPEDGTSARGPEPVGGQRYGELLANAVRVLTDAARLTRPVLTRDEGATAATGRPVWVDSARTEPADWAEFVTLALAGAAANIGGIEAVLAGRPGSWEADGVRQLLVSTVGHDEQHLLEHRTEPLVVDVHVDAIMAENGVWTAYQDAELEVSLRYDGQPEPGPDATDEQWQEVDRQVDETAELQQRLQAQRQQDWAAYGQALKSSIEAAAGRRPDLLLPVVVRVDLEYRTSTPDTGGGPTDGGIAEQLLGEALAATPLPGDGHPLLQRLSTPVP